MSVGKAYQDGIDVHIRGIQCYLTDSNGELVGHARHVFPYQWLTDLSLQDKMVSTFHTKCRYRDTKKSLE